MALQNPRASFPCAQSTTTAPTNVSPTGTSTGPPSGVSRMPKRGRKSSACSSSCFFCLRADRSVNTVDAANRAMVTAFAAKNPAMPEPPAAAAAATGAAI